MDISQAAQPRSDQLNADDLIGGPQVVTIAEVRRGSQEQPVEIVTEEFGPGRPYKPNKSMIRVLLTAWGREASAYTGRRLLLYRDAEVRFGKDAVGGIRIGSMSDIDSRLSIMLTVTRGKRAPFAVEPLPDLPPAITPETAAEIQERINNATTLDQLKTIGAELKTTNLGEHRDNLLNAWSQRKSELESHD